VGHVGAIVSLVLILGEGHYAPRSMRVSNITIFMYGVLVGSLLFVFVNSVFAQEIVGDPVQLQEEVAIDVPVEAQVIETVSSGDISEVTTTTNDQIGGEEIVQIVPFSSPLSLSAKGIAIDDVPVLQAEYYEVKGKYQQVRDLVNVYETETGWGFQTVEKLPDRVVYVGYGPLADEYTYEVYIPIPSGVSSSTPIV